MTTVSHAPPAERDSQALAAAEHIAAAVLRPLANDLDRRGGFPAAQLEAIRAAGLAGMGIPAAFGGLECSELAQARCFAALAAGDVTPAFVLTQHQSCASLVAASPRLDLRARWLPGLADGTLHGANGFNFLNFPPERAPMRAEIVPGGYRLRGELPWVTAAAHSDLLAAGAVLPDGAQVLLAIPLRRDLAAQPERIRVDPPLDLAALAASATTVVRCDDYVVPDDAVILGPGPDLLKTTVRGATAYVPTALTLGHARACREIVQDAAARKGGTARAMADWLSAEIDRLDEDMVGALEYGDFTQAPMLRGRGNALAARAAHFALIAGGGTGYRRDRTPQRLYREAGFFSVWSVSGQIIPETLAHLLAPL